MRTLTLAVLASVVLPAAGAAAAPEEVVLSLSGSRALRVPVHVNGRGPFTFLLDTGASHGTVSGELAERLALPVVAQVRVVTTAGPRMRQVVRVERMAIGSATGSGLMPSVVPTAQLRALEPGIDGIIGQDFLSAFDYTLDYRRRRLRWSAGPEEGLARLPLVHAAGRALVRLAGDGGRGPVLMVPDSGSEGLVLFARHGRPPVPVDEAARRVAVEAVGASRPGRGALLRELRVGGVTLRNEPAVIVEGGGDQAVEGDGLLPLHHFSRVSISNSEGFMTVR
ncbi:MAG TPA: aspartyl protease family protein [Vicinamibacteria bacterium]|nr:aspartyl protease family protein [Vicinamibacteria bacterium]